MNATALLASLILLMPTGVNAPTASVDTGSLVFVTNAASDNEYARMTALPSGFGSGDWTLEVRILPDHTIGTGDTSVYESTNQRTLWSNNNETPYSAADWWFNGNFLLDGHNNNAYYDGTLSAQVVDSGRVRVLIGDGAAANARTGDLHALTSTSSILDGNPHMLSISRDSDGGSGSLFSLRLDGVTEDTETSSTYTDMTDYWNSWPGYPSGQSGWFWGAEKQAAVGVLTQWEDYKGRIGEVRFWGVARSESEIAATDDAPIDAGASGLLAVYRMSEGSGTTAADALAAGGNITLNNGAGGQQVTWQSAIY